MHRFFIPSDWIKPPQVELHGNTARQIALVLRLNPGETITVLDGGQLERSVRIIRVTKSLVEGVIIAESLAIDEPGTHLSLYIGLTQRTKVEWILQKGTELGVAKFIPVITSRSLVREAAAGGRKSERWEGILREAAEQCGRWKIPEIGPVVSLNKALAEGKQENALCLIAWESESNGNLKTTLTTLDRARPASVAVMIGPEGGLTEDEVRMATDLDWKPISLGRRILRMETAALVISSLIMYELGDLNPPIDVATNS